MNEYTISIAQQSDLADIVGIYNSTVAGRQSTADLVPASIESKQAWFDVHGGNRPLLVLKNQAGELMAWGSFSDYYPRDAYRITAEISIYVRHDMRGVGVGKILLRYMMEKAPQLDIHNIIAVIFGHNHASIRLFHSFGFEEWGRLPQVCDMEGMLADIVLLGKKVLN